MVSDGFWGWMQRVREVPEYGMLCDGKELRRHYQWEVDIRPSGLLAGVHPSCFCHLSPGFFLSFLRSNKVISTLTVDASRSGLTGCLLL